MLRLAWLMSVMTLLSGCGDDRGGSPDVAVEVGYVAVDERVGSPVIVLKEKAGVRNLPIWIGLSEARSIAAEMEKHRPTRPNTHDLAIRLIQGLEGTLERVVVTELKSGIYYASLVLGARGRSIAIDSRPSDAIAIGLRMQAPLYARESLLDSDDERDPGREVQLPWPRVPGDESATWPLESAIFDGNGGPEALRPASLRLH